MARVMYEAVATVGTYKAANGEEKKRYQRIGTVFQGDKGLSLKIDAIPVGNEWNGWVSFFEPKNQGVDRTPADAYKKRVDTRQDDEGEIPF